MALGIKSKPFARVTNDISLDDISPALTLHTLKVTSGVSPKDSCVETWSPGQQRSELTLEERDGS